jgi:large subunit ribosomal protein L18
MSMKTDRKDIRKQRKIRIRKKIQGTSERPRLCVFRSSRHIDAQIIDDTNGSTIVSASTYEKGVREGEKFDSKVAAAVFIGEQIAKRALEKGISKVVFDRNGYLYHGRIKAVSEGARKGGLVF